MPRLTIRNQCSCHFTSRSVNRVFPFSNARCRSFRIFISTNFSSSLAVASRRTTKRRGSLFFLVRSLVSPYRVRYVLARSISCFRGQIFARSSLDIQNQRKKSDHSPDANFRIVFECFLNILKLHHDYRVIRRWNDSQPSCFYLLRYSSVYKFGYLSAFIDETAVESYIVYLCKWTILVETR